MLFWLPEDSRGKEPPSKRNLIPSTENTKEHGEVEGGGGKGNRIGGGHTLARKEQTTKTQERGKRAVALRGRKQGNIAGVRVEGQGGPAYTLSAITHLDLVTDRLTLSTLLSLWGWMRA